MCHSDLLPTQSVEESAGEERDGERQCVGGRIVIAQNRRESWTKSVAAAAKAGIMVTSSLSTSHTLLSPPSLLSLSLALSASRSFSLSRSVVTEGNFEATPAGRTGQYTTAASLHDSGDLVVETRQAICADCRR